MKSFIDVQHCLNVVIPRGQQVQVHQRIAESPRINGCTGSRSKGINIEPEKLGAFSLLFAKPIARFRLFVLGDPEQNVTINGLAAQARRKTDLEAELTGSSRVLGNRRLWHS